MKAQIWSSDFAVSAVIFLATLLVLFFTWQYIVTQNEEQASLKEIETLALAISDGLVRTPGVPDGWNSSTVNSLGLVSQENVLVDSKIQQLLGLDYDRVKRLLGAGQYDFQLLVKNLNGSIAQTLSGTNITYGLPPAGERMVVPVERYCMLNGNPVRLDLVFWSGF
jgi:hypothetical protein